MQHVMPIPFMLSRGESQSNENLRLPAEQSVCEGI
jgi:hypothetical protein